MNNVCSSDFMPKSEYIFSYNFETVKIALNKKRPCIEQQLLDYQHLKSTRLLQSFVCCTSYFGHLKHRNVVIFSSPCKEDLLISPSNIS